jgi:alpha-galactosidase
MPMSFLTQVAQTPPMGWNSFDAYGSAVTEAEFRANVDVMAERLRPHGWEYAVIDFCWSHPSPGPCHNPHQGPGFSPMLETDRWGRLVPAPGRFPSSKGGVGFAPLADYVHSKGLKFGIHVMRGIPRQVVLEDLPVKGTRWRASEVAVQDPAQACTWLNHMWGVDMAHPGGQAYYDSLFELYASWGVDFVKVDDILADGHFDSRGPYHAAEIEAIGRAIDRCGRPMVLSLSPGDAPKSCADHVSNHASMWRISADFWDDWRRLKRQFDLCDWWTPWRKPGRWPDADMLPIGRLSKRGPKGPERDSWFTPDEQRTLMTLVCLSQSPLMMGGALTDLDSATERLLTCPELLRLNQCGRNARQLEREGDRVVWTAEVDGRRALALFNLSDEPLPCSVSLRVHSFPETAAVDGWSGEPVAPLDGTVTRVLPPHGCALVITGP